MSGDVQPRKRKDKKRKKDELGVEEPRGTAAVLGEGDVFMHSQHDHGTGGHWCAKVIFFSLLAILVALIGLIILENRGLSELEANSVESRYSGVLEGWLEDAPDDDHHDAHTLELKHGDDEEDDHEEAEEEVTEVEVEKIEKEASEEEDPESWELPELPEADDDLNGDDDSKVDEIEEDEVDDDKGNLEDDDDFLEADDNEPPIERITAPAGKPFLEVEDDISSERPPDTLEEEEEYEKQQEELRKEEEKGSNMWLKLFVGGALLVATHAVMRRATGPRDVPEREARAPREETPIIDRRMTLIPEETAEPAVTTKTVRQESARPVGEVLTKRSFIEKSVTPAKEESEEEEEPEEIEEIEVDEEKKKLGEELYSDEEVAEDEEEIVEESKPVPVLTVPVAKPPEPEPEPEEEIPDDVEIIDDEQIEEELEEEVDDEEEISDVDDTELLSRLEAKYGRLPEPERPGQKHSKRSLRVTAYICSCCWHVLINPLTLPA